MKDVAHAEARKRIAGLDAVIESFSTSVEDMSATLSARAAWVEVLEGVRDPQTSAALVKVLLKAAKNDALLYAAYVRPALWADLGRHRGLSMYGCGDTEVRVRLGERVIGLRPDPHLSTDLIYLVNSIGQAPVIVPPEHLSVEQSELYVRLRHGGLGPEDTLGVVRDALKTASHKIAARPSGHGRGLNVG